MNNHIDTILETTTPRQTRAEQEQLFARVMTEIGVATKTADAVPSPYFSLRTLLGNSRVLVAALLIVLLGTGGTVAASESARPGDFLFPIERATEQLRLTIASAEKRGELEAEFLDKRFVELGELLDEEVFASSSATERLVSEAGEGRIAGAIAVLLLQAEGRSNPQQTERLRTLLREVEMLRVEGRSPEQVNQGRIRVDDSRIEVRTDTSRIRIDDTDGELRIRYTNDDDEDDDDGFDDNDGNRSSDDDKDDRLSDDDKDDDTKSRNMTGGANEQNDSIRSVADQNEESESAVGTGWDDADKDDRTEDEDSDRDGGDRNDDDHDPNRDDDKDDKDDRDDDDHDN
ncbi:MAG: hypothetical protein MUF19_02010 [Candidatus Pacebacteria bacterium]|jgi:hypothetical protein|nr:hypothetical protein [Candidatus Paceibacterota bacterium]